VESDLGNDAADDHRGTMRYINRYLMRMCLVLCICTLCISALFSCEVRANEASQAPLVKESMLLDVALGEKAVIVGERGHILVADATDVTLPDASSLGDALKQVSVPSKATLTGVDSVGNTVLAVGHDATILRSSDGGLSWELVLSAPELDRPFLDVLFISEAEAIAVGAYGLFYRSMDAGLTWQQEQHVSLLSPDDIEYLESIADDEEFYQEELNFIFPHFNRLSKSNGRLYLAGEAGLLASSNDLFTTAYTRAFTTPYTTP